MGTFYLEIMYMAEIVENPRFKDESISQEILNILTSKLDFTIPKVDYRDLDVSFPDELIKELSKTPEMPKPDNLANNDVEDSVPSYNRIMNAFRATLADEADKDRIDKSQYATILQAVMSTAMELAVQYELNRYTNKYTSISAAIKAKADVVTAMTQAAIAKMQLAQAQSNAHTARAQFASTVMDLGIKDSSYGSNQQNIKVAQKQIDQMNQNINASVSSVSRDDRIADKQIELMGQNIASSKASVTRDDKIADQQIESSKLRDVRDLGKVYSDVYLTQKGVDEGTATPTSLTSPNIDAVMTKLRTMHKL